VSGIARDITERKRAEEAVARHSAIVESSEDAIISETLDAIITSWNAGAQRIFGYTEDEAIGQPINILIPPELREDERKILEKLRAGERVEHYETIRVTKAGKRVNVSLSISPIRDASGKITGISKIARDITERKETEDALRHSEEKFLKAFRQCPVAVALSSLKDGRFIEVNSTFEHFFGYLHEEVIGRTVSDIGIWVDSSQREQLVKRLLSEQGVRDLELRFRTKNGGIRTCLVSAEPIEVGNELCILSVTSDITERKLSEEALRTSEERLRLAQKVARIGSFEWNMQTGVNICTPELRSMYGLPPGGFGGTESAFEKLVHPDDFARVRQFVDEALKTGRPMQGEWRIIWPDGSVHWIAGRWQVFRNESGEPSRMLGVNMDITDRKKMEETLSGMTRKLLQAQEQERARIARELHDDINQRLALLAIELEQLKENPAEVGSLVEELRKQATDISKDVQALSHDLHSPKLEYLGVVGGMKSWCREFGERQGMQIDCSHDVQSSLPAEIGLCLFRVLQESLHNAAKYSGVKRVEVQLHEKPGEIQLVVSDSGRGFDVDAVKQDKGLGLISMQERVRLVNGTISIESKPMRGTTIHVRVPFRSEHASRAAG
jgi:PAS domain S-box-containing protein